MPVRRNCPDSPIFLPKVMTLAADNNNVIAKHNGA